MKEKRFRSGQVIYRQGEPGNAIFVIAEGQVEVLREVGGENVRLDLLGKGAIFGESAVIRNKARSTTVQARGPVTLMVLPKDDFLSVFGRENSLALPLLKALCERLAQAQSQLMTHRIFSEGARRSEVGRIRVLPDSSEMQAQIGSKGIVVGELPFRLGRRIKPDEPPSATKAELMLQCAHGDEISPLQFAIQDLEGRLVVRDLESHLGTLVDGQRIAHFEQSQTADLRFGATPVQAGGLESSYRFQIIVERAAV